jgi:hypothetical protein
MPRIPSFVRKLLFFIACLGIFTLVVIFLEPPESWEEASVWQIMAFFLPLLLGATAVIDILVHYFPHSFIIALGGILLLAFYAVSQLNLLTGSLVILATALFVRLFPKMRMPRFRLTSGSKIPKLHMQKQEAPQMRRLRRINRG